jgi:hypothetical protein
MVLSCCRGTGVRIGLTADVALPSDMSHQPQLHHASMQPTCSATQSQSHTTKGDQSVCYALHYQATLHCWQPTCSATSSASGALTTSAGVNKGSAARWSTKGQQRVNQRVNKGSTRGLQPGGQQRVNKGSTKGQQRVNKGSAARWSRGCIATNSNHHMQLHGRCRSSGSKRQQQARRLAQQVLQEEPAAGCVWQVQ